jgi:hypothetical protein
MNIYLLSSSTYTHPHPPSLLDSAHMSLRSYTPETKSTDATTPAGGATSATTPAGAIPLPAEVMKSRIAHLATTVTSGGASAATATRAADAEKMLAAFKEDVRATVLAKIEELASRASDERPSGTIWDPECMKKRYDCGVIKYGPLLGGGQGGEAPATGVPARVLMRGWRVHSTDTVIRRPFDEVVDEFARSGWTLEDISDRAKSFRTVWRISA